MSKITVGLMEPIKRWESHYHPMGIMYISSYLEKYGYKNYLICKKSFSNDISELDIIEIESLVLDKISQIKPELLGLSCAINELNYVYSFCKKVKEKFPLLKIMVGGPMPSSSPEIFLRDETIDFVVRGEGEEVVLNLVRCLEKDENLSVVKGISYKKEGQIIHNELCHLIENLDSIPYPAYEKVNMEQYISMHEWVIRGFPLKGIFEITSRGCPYRCTFCGASTVHGRKVRFRSAENVYAELKFLRDNYGVEGVFFSGDTFTLNKRHVLEISSIMKELNLVWSCFARVDTIDEDLLRIMKANGCLQLDFGVESGSNRILSKIIKKGTTVAQARNVFTLCRKYKMRTFANLMIGLPTETEEEMNATFNLSKELKAHAYILSIAMPFPNTELWNMVTPKIEIREFDNLNWHGEDFNLTDRCNKSLVPTSRLIYLHNYFTKELQKMARLITLKSYHIYIAEFMKMGNKFGRFKFEIMDGLRQNNQLLMIYLYLKKRFKIVGRINQFIKSFRNKWK